MHRKWHGDDVVLLLIAILCILSLNGPNCTGSTAAPASPRSNTGQTGGIGHLFQLDNLWGFQTAQVLPANGNKTPCLTNQLRVPLSATMKGSEEGREQSDCTAHSFSGRKALSSNDDEHLSIISSDNNGMDFFSKTAQLYPYEVAAWKRLQIGNDGNASFTLAGMWFSHSIINSEPSQSNGDSSSGYYWEESSLNVPSSFLKKYFTTNDWLDRAIGHNIFTNNDFLLQNQFAPSQGLAMTFAEPITQNENNNDAEKMEMEAEVVDWDGIGISTIIQFSSRKIVSSRINNKKQDDGSSIFRKGSHSITRKRMTFPLVQGMVYATAIYEDLVPKIKTGSKVVHLMEEKNLFNNEEEGSKHRLVLANAEVWFIYALEQKIDFTQVNDNELVASTKFSGVIRICKVPTNGGRSKRNNYENTSSSDEATVEDIQLLLDKHSRTYPVGCTFTVGAMDEKNIDTCNSSSFFVGSKNGNANIQPPEQDSLGTPMQYYKLEWAVQTSKHLPLTDLLHYNSLFPHHQNIIECASKTTLESESSNKGTMFAFAGNAWSFREESLFNNSSNGSKEGFSVQASDDDERTNEKKSIVTEEKGEPELKKKKNIMDNNTGPPADDSGGNNNKPFFNNHHHHSLGDSLPTTEEASSSSLLSTKHHHDSTTKHSSRLRRNRKIKHQFFAILGLIFTAFVVFAIFLYVCRHKYSKTKFYQGARYSSVHLKTDDNDNNRPSCEEDASSDDSSFFENFDKLSLMELGKRERQQERQPLFRSRRRSPPGHNNTPLYYYDSSQEDQRTSSPVNTRGAGTTVRECQGKSRYHHHHRSRSEAMVDDYQTQWNDGPQQNSPIATSSTHHKSSLEHHHHLLASFSDAHERLSI